MLSVRKATIALLAVATVMLGATAPVLPAAAGRDHPVHPVHPGNPGGKDDDKEDKDDPPAPPSTPQPPSVHTVGQVVLGQANIPMRSGSRGFARGIRQVLAGSPDFVTLNEQFGRSVQTITSVATGYSGFRVNTVPSGRGSREALGNVVLWRTGAWSRVAGGRIRLVDDDRVRFRGRIVVWDRYATWATLRSTASGEIVSVVSVHHMTNPAKYGPRRSVRQRAYRVGMNRLLRLGARLDDQGPVLFGGDFNVHAGQRQSWTATTRMRSAGHQWHSSGVNYRARISDHPFLVARFALNTAGQRMRSDPLC